MIEGREHPISPLVVIVGPTGAGKSSLAVAVAERVGGEIVCADSMQVYRGLDIGTAKASAEMRRRIPHHLVDLLDPDEPFTAADYRRQARAAISDIRARDRTPIMVGGTGLYVRACLRGLFDGPGEDRAVRLALRREATRADAPSLHTRLLGLDPKAAAAIHPNDLFRIVRALEVATVTGRPISSLREESRRRHRPMPGQVLRFGLERERKELYQRIDARVEEMMARGLLGEVRSLLDRGYARTLKPLRAIGYRHMIDHLGGHSTLDEAVDRLKRDTRRYAKRQLTWFRHEEGVTWCPVTGPDVGEPVLRSVVARIEGAWASRG
jgi:tRNA dimethylallyltransferase